MMRYLTTSTAAALFLFAGTAVATAQQPAMDDKLLPPNAKAGECCARVFVPPTYTTQTETLLKRAAGEEIKVMPARHEWVEERVQVEAASERLEVVPARYETREERVLVKEASERLVTRPAVYENAEERVLVKAAYTTWQKGRGLIERVDNATGEIMCLVEVPAEYRTVQKRVVKTPASVEKVVIPAEYRTVRKRVMVEPPRTEKVAIPAKFDTVRVLKLVDQAKEVRTPIPAEYQTVSRQVRASEGRLEWRQVLCETNARPNLIQDIQRALQARGHNPGPIDGRLGKQTMSAVASFQSAQRLPSGQLTMDTIRALGVRI